MKFEENRDCWNKRVQFIDAIFEVKMSMLKYINILSVN